MILARHAEALFWGGRQLERTEHSTRVLDISSRSTMHHVPERAARRWLAVLRSLGLATAFDQTGHQHTEPNVTAFVFHDGTNPGAVSSSVHLLRENIRTVRDRVPVELWEEINRLHLELTENLRSAALESQRFEVFSSVRRSCQAATGIVTDAMPRDEGHTFFQVGRMLERATMVGRLVRCSAFPSDPADLDMMTLLRMASSLQAFRRIHSYDDDPMTVALFLLQSDRLPRSVYSCIRQVEDLLAPLEARAPGIRPARHRVGRLRSELEFGDVSDSLASDPVVHIVGIENELAKLAETIASQAFDPTLMTHRSQFVRPGSDR